MADLAGEYLRGLDIGARIKQARADAAQQEAHDLMAAQARSQQLAAENARANARLQFEKAMRGQQLQLEQARLAAVEQANARRTQQAAMTLAAQQQFAQDLAGGMDVGQALYRNPMLATPQNVERATAQRRLEGRADATDANRSRALDLQAQNLGLQKRRLDDAEGGAAERAKLAGVRNTPHVRITSPLSLEGPQWQVNLPEGDPTIGKLLGTNAPAALTQPRGGEDAGGSAGATQFEAVPGQREDRKAGTTYKTPKGLFTWTGKGWTPFQNGGQ